MDNNKTQVAKNIRSLREAVGVNQTNLGKAVNATKTVISNLERALNKSGEGHINLLSKYFLVQEDMLKNVDLADYNPKVAGVKLDTLKSVIELIFPIVCTEEAMTDPYFKEGYEKITEYNNNRLNGRNADSAQFEEAIEAFYKSVDKNGTKASIANLLSCIMVRCMSTNQEDAKTLYFEIFGKRKNVDNILNNFYFRNKKTVKERSDEEEIIRTERKEVFKEYASVFAKGIGILKGNKEYQEIGDYLWALTYLQDLVENFFDQKTNFLIGLEMLEDLEMQGNRYAKRFWSIFK